MKNFKIFLPIFFSIIVSLFNASDVYARPATEVEFDCTHLHWEMQNDHERFVQKFVGEVSYPVEELHSVLLQPGEWGVLDVTFPEFNGPMRVKASIYIAGDVRRIDKVINCGEMPIGEDESTRAALPKVLKSSNVQEKNASISAQVKEVEVPTTLPETGFGIFNLLAIICGGLIGLFMARFSNKKSNNNK